MLWYFRVEGTQVLSDFGGKTSAATPLEEPRVFQENISEICIRNT
jgi:hypothetical protein